MTDAYKLGENRWRNRIIGYDEADPEQLLANPQNYRVHPKYQQDALAGALEEIGWLQTVIVNVTTGHMIDGHLRVQLAMRNDESTVPVTLVELTEEEERLALATFDPITALAGHDAEILDGLLRDVQTGDADLQALLSEIAEDAGLYFGENGDGEADAEPQVDRASELRQEWGVETGQLWRLPSRTEGQEHRLICGDCTDAGVVEQVVDGEKADCVVTDPPFAIYGSSTGAKNDRNMIYPFFREVWKTISSTGAHDVYVFCDWRSYPVIDATLIGYDIKDVIVWDKGSGGLGQPYMRRHEFIVFARPSTSDIKMFGRDKETGKRITDDDVWQVARVTDKAHNAQKPLEVLERALGNSTDEGQIVYEPFAGSGTTIIACENLGRQCRAIEISPAYCAVALDRYERAFGITPELVAHNEVA